MLLELRHHGRGVKGMLTIDEAIRQADAILQETHGYPEALRARIAGLLCERALLKDFARELLEETCP